MLRLQNADVFEQLRQQVDLTGQGAPVLQLDTTVVPVIVLESPGTAVSVFSGATHGPAAGNGAWFQIRAGTVSPLRVDKLILLATAAANILYGMFNTPIGTPANSKAVWEMAPKVRSAAAGPEWLGGASFLFSEQAVAGFVSANYSSGVYLGAGGTYIIDFPEPFIIPPNACLEVGCVNAAVLCGCSFHGAQLVG